MSDTQTCFSSALYCTVTQIS